MGEVKRNKPAVTTGAARNKLVEENLPLVGYWVKRFYRAVPAARASYASEDAFQDGSIGLVRAAELYNGNFGVCFSTYASSWIRQAMDRGLQKSRIVHVPENYVKGNKKGQIRIPKTDHPSQKINHLGKQLIWNPTDISNPRVFTKVVENEKRATLRKMLSRVHGREREILMMRWFEYKTLDEVADYMGFGRERARQLENKGLHYLKRQFALAGIGEELLD